MRLIPVLAILMIGVPLSAQTPQADTSTLPALLAEVRQLRIAIEQSTLIGNRIQIALMRMQMQQARVERMSQDIDRSQRDLEQFESERSGAKRVLKEVESQLDKTTDPRVRADLDREVTNQKQNVEQVDARELQMQARAAELNGQMRTEQANLSQLQGEVGDLEKALDAAIRQLSGQH